ncbi:arylamine N-acetyltransferase [Streptomyces armeniacus]|uniref:Arylamine N-acetyltransferase n=1 Tax=Streptomyces armeniacus TaxID=83291 RepID=A0A345XLP8_9ACTN|nr:arylamine N-acetyltransferase [Streptomyces armeniacus]AXK32564.1 arylamine N-acetyltransferase [Streptomyces armeniacus]
MDTPVDAYLRRIGAGRPAAADPAGLRELHRRHLIAVPFENLSIHLGEDIVLDEKLILAKIVDARRGGFCYELNGAFGALLRELGYGVSLLAARPYEGKRPTVPYSHLALRVEAADGSRWLADVGFGKHSEYPLSLDDSGEQTDPGGVFRIVPTEDDDLDVLMNGKLEYRLERRPRELADFEVGSWYNRTSPRSHFTGSLVCSRLAEDGGRLTLSGRNLVTTSAQGARTERELAADEVLDTYRDLFGLELDREPRVVDRSPRMVDETDVAGGADGTPGNAGT